MPPTSIDFGHSALRPKFFSPLYCERCPSLQTCRRFSPGTNGERRARRASTSPRSPSPRRSPALAAPRPRSAVLVKVGDLAHRHVVLRCVALAVRPKTPVVALHHALLAVSLRTRAVQDQSDQLVACSAVLACPCAPAGTGRRAHTCAVNHGAAAPTKDARTRRVRIRLPFISYTAA